MKSENNSKRKQDIHVTVSPGTLEWLGEVFRCPPEVALSIVTHVATKKEEGEFELCQSRQNYTQ